MAIILTAYPASLELTQGDFIVEGTINANDVQFVLPAGDSTWEGMTLVACFRSLLCERSVVLDFDTLSCKFPWEVNAKGSVGSPVSIGLYGAGDPKGTTVVRSTVWVDMPFRVLPSTNDTAETPNGSCDDGNMEPSKEPTPSQYQQMLVAVSDVVQRMDALGGTEDAVAQSAEQAARSQQVATEQAALAASYAKIASNAYIDLSANYNETIIGLYVDGQTITYIKGDGSVHSFETQDTNTTYSLATDEVTGLTRLYATTGSAEDGTMTQKAICTELDKKVGVTVDATQNTLIFTK